MRLYELLVSSKYISHGRFWSSLLFLEETAQNTEADAGL